MTCVDLWLKGCMVNMEDQQITQKRQRKNEDQYQEAKELKVIINELEEQSKVMNKKPMMIQLKDLRKEDKGDLGCAGCTDLEVDFVRCVNYVDCAHGLECEKREIGWLNCVGWTCNTKGISMDGKENQSDDW